MSKSVLSILHTESSCGWGGQEIRILTESQGMVQRGHHVTLVCCPNSKIAKAPLTMVLRLSHYRLKKNADLH